MAVDPKEFLRRAFNAGHYDVTASEQDVVEFCEIFSGEYEADLAFQISHNLLSKSAKNKCRPHTSL